MKYTFFGTIKNGKLIFDHQRMYKEAIACCRDMRVEIIIKQESFDVSLDQWRYLYACVYTPFADQFGWTIDEVDKWMKEKFMEENLIKLPEGLRLTKTCFDRVGLAKYIDSCIRFAAEEGLSVMPPNPEWRKEL